MPKLVSPATWQRQKARYYAKHRHTLGRRPWKSEEIATVMAHAISDVELARKLGRSVQAIHVKRAKVKSDNGDGKHG